MRYRKCDRCGKRIVSGADFYPAMIKGYLAEEVTVKSIWVSTTKHPRCQFELCDGCGQSFADWFYEKGEKDGTEKQI